MLRKLLFLSFVVALVVGLTLPAFAQINDSSEEENGKKEEHGKYEFDAWCKCDWHVTLTWTKNGYPIGDPKDFGKCSKRGIHEVIEKPKDANDVEVNAVLQHNRKKLTADCTLDKHKFDDLKDLHGGCHIDRCKFEFELEKKRHRRDGNGDDD
jgi:hypothetical protein